MTRDHLLVGLDIGSSKVTVTVVTATDQALHVTGVASVGHDGLRHGAVSDLDETVTAIGQALEDAERMAGTRLTHATVSITGRHITCQQAKGVIAVSKPNGEIDQTDVARVIDAAKTTAMPQNRELLHIFPHHYLVDGHDDIRDPAGLTGIRLEVDASIVTSSASAMRNLEKAVMQAGLQIDGLVFAPLAAARAATTKKQRESGVVLIDIGSGATSFAVYEEGELLHCGCIPIGSMHITNDIAIGMRTNLDIADMIKINHGHSQPSKIRDGEMVNLNTLDPGETEKVSRRHVAEIIEARTAELFHLIQEQLQYIGRDGLLPAGAVITGGGSELEGLIDQAKDTLRLPAQIGYPMTQFSGMIDKIDSPLYATSVGLILWSLEEGYQPTAPWRPSIGKMGGVFDRFKGILKNFTN